MTLATLETKLRYYLYDTQMIIHLSILYYNYTKLNFPYFERYSLYKLSRPNPSIPLIFSTLRSKKEKEKQKSEQKRRSAKKQVADP